MSGEDTGQFRSQDKRKERLSDQMLKK